MPLVTLRRGDAGPIVPRHLKMTGLHSLTFIDFVRNIHLYWQQEKRVDEKLHFKTESEQMKLFLTH